MTQRICALLQPPMQIPTDRDKLEDGHHLAEEDTEFALLNDEELTFVRLFEDPDYFNLEGKE